MSCFKKPSKNFFFEPKGHFRTFLRKNFCPRWQVENSTLTLKFWALRSKRVKRSFGARTTLFMTWWTWSSHIESHISQYHSLLASLLLVFLSAWTNSWSCLTTVTAFRPRCPIITAFLNIATFCFGEWLTKVIRTICTGSCSCLATSIACFRTIWPWAPIT